MISEADPMRTKFRVEVKLHSIFNCPRSAAPRLSARYFDSFLKIDQMT
jgi:hypothetical protein